MKKKDANLTKATYAAFMIFFILHGAPTGADAMVVWTEHATAKIRDTALLTPPKPTQTSAVLKAAKNEFESFQLIVTADQADLSNVDVTVSDLTDGHGNTLSGRSVMLYKEVYIAVTTPSDIQGATGLWPDALIPKKDDYVGEVRNAFPFSVTKGNNQPVWIEFYIPPTAIAGVYSGKLTVTASGQNAVTVPIQLTIWNFALPSTATLKSAYSIDYHLVPIGHGLGAFINPAKPEHLQLIKLYAKANLLHRLTTDYLPAPEVLGGFLSNGKINWAAYDAAYGPLLNGTESLPSGKLPGARMTSYRMSIWGDELNIPFLQDIAQHFKDKGWFDRLFEYTVDEPKTADDWTFIQTRATALHQADPKLRSLVTTSVQAATANGVAGFIDLFAPTIRFMDNKPDGFAIGTTEPPGDVAGQPSTVGNQRARYGPEVWWYQACGSHGCNMIGGTAPDRAGYHTGWPTYMIDLPAMFNRVMQWMSFKYDIQGELYYDLVFAYDQGDAWVTQYYFGGNGDGTLYYPGSPDKIGGTHHIPIESIRLKLIREGMEDYEYLSLLQSLGDDAFAQQQLSRIVTNTYTFDKEPLDLYDAREKIALKILSDQKPNRPSAPANVQIH
ncbi:MAG: DUF4091 domain-containing protein [Nitrospirae bacterium]|nr:DUF4091 domain-containing protein [Candidatus Manganitrophaceae bacterium]